MSTAERDDWTGAQLAAHLAALQGMAPEPAEHVIVRCTLRPGDPETRLGKTRPGNSDPALEATQPGNPETRLEATRPGNSETALEATRPGNPAAQFEETQLYYVADEPVPLSQAALPAWLARHHLRGADRLALAMLVVRETLDQAGLIRECSLERRRGALDGPLVGDPARVEFIGPARMVRLYRVRRDGRLAEVVGSADTLPQRHLTADHFAGEQCALQAQFGRETRMLDAREPLLFEAMVGLDSILHVRLADGREIGCGIGWHGPLPFVLAADFPRFSAPLLLAPEHEAAVQEVLARDNLVRHETRLVQGGLVVIARHRGGTDLFLLRADVGAVTAVPYQPRPAGIASGDQYRWMRYAEKFERLAVLDAWRDGDSADLLVITGDESGEIWRHHIDADGVETWRKPDEVAAAGLLYREQLSRGTLAASDAATAESNPGTRDDLLNHDLAEPAPAHSLLAKTEAYVAVLAALHRAQESAYSEAPPTDALPHLQALLAALDTLEAEHAAIEARLLLAQVEYHRIGPARLAAALVRLEARLPDELAETRLVSLTPAQWRYLVNPAPFGVAVEHAFPETAYDIEEAALCLAYRRPSAAAFHCMRIVQAGLAALGASLHTPLQVEERQWAQILTLLRSTTPPEQAPLLAALEQVRRCCRGARLVPADKYTEAEAQRLFRTVGAFMAELAAVLGRRSAP